MKRSAQVAAVALLVVLLGHPLAAVCACWQSAPTEVAPAGSCHGSTQPGSSVENTGRDCCLVSPATPAPPQPSVRDASVSLLSLPSLQAAAAKTSEPAAKSPESPPRALESRHALLGVFLI